MKIERDGKSWELTNEELRQAYQEQQKIYDRANIEDNFQWVMESAGLEDIKDELEDNEEFLNLAAYYSRDLQDGCDTSFSDSLTQAAQRAARELKESGKISAARKREAKYVML